MEPNEPNIPNETDKTTTDANTASAYANTTPEQNTQVPESDQKEEQTAKVRSIVRTYTGDVRGLVRNQKLSLAKMVASQEGATATAQTAPQAKRQSDSGFWRKMTFAGIGVLFITIFFVFFSELYLQRTTGDNSRIIIDAFPAVIFTESHKEVEVNTATKGVLARSLSLMNANTFISPGTFADFVLLTTATDNDGKSTTRQILAPEFLQSLAIGSGSVSATFIQALDDVYMVGTHALDENVPFIIFSTHAYGNAFSGIIDWERTMIDDLAPFFDRGASFSLEEIAVSGTNGFEDIVVQNMDVRVLRDAEDVVRIAYTFVDRGTIVIAGGIRTLVAVANRARMVGQ